MRVIDYLIQTKQTHFSFEILPPLKGNSIDTVYKIIDDLLEFDPKYINITSHRNDVVYNKNKDDSFTKIQLSRRPGTVAISSAILNKYKINVVPHVICNGYSKLEIEYTLIDLAYLGIFDLLLLKGDNIKGDKNKLINKKKTSQYALDLICQVEEFNIGNYIDNTTFSPLQKKFIYGVAGYPEKHEDAPNLDTDILYLKQKVDNGAQYIVTQIFFDNKKFFHFKEKAQKAGIRVPIIPGLKPLTKLRQIELLPKIFKTEIPQPLLKELTKCKTDKEVAILGVEWTIEQCKELIRHKVPSLHFYPMFDSNSISKIAKKIY